MLGDVAWGYWRVEIVAREPREYCQPCIQIEDERGISFNRLDMSTGRDCKSVNCFMANLREEDSSALDYICVHCKILLPSKSRLNKQTRID